MKRPILAGNRASKKKGVIVYEPFTEGSSISHSPEHDETNLGDIDHVEESPVSEELPTVHEEPQPLGSTNEILLPRTRRLPVRYIQDTLPEGPAWLRDLVPNDIDSVAEPELALAPRQPIRSLILNGHGTIRLHLTPTARVAPNKFGLSRFYYGLPSSLPDETQRGSQAMVTERASAAVLTETATQAAASFGPYPNWSTMQLGTWFLSVTAQKSLDDFSKLLGVLHSDQFSLDDTRDIAWSSIFRQLAFEGGTAGSLGRGWISSTVEILVPSGEKCSASSPFAKGIPFVIPGFHHRSIPALMDVVFGKDAASKRFHHVPFSQSWQPHNNTWPKERVHGELFSSPAFIREHEKLQSSPAEPECNLPRVIAAIMLGSDSMRLAAFGHASLWPLYLWWGNQSMYERGMPSAEADHPIAYLVKLPDNVLRFIKEYNLRRRGKRRNDPLLAHLRRELFHACLTVLFRDQDFRQAYDHGRVITGSDGVVRRHYPRFFTYSADYPEKALIATIREMGGTPTPQTLVKKDDLHLMGTASDMLARTASPRDDDHGRRRGVSDARSLLYRSGYVVNSKKIEALLKSQSWVPTENAFSWLKDTGGPSAMRLLAPDITHEWELGVWKAVFMHLIRILHLLGHDAFIVELNRRYRETDPFGSDGVRRFPENVADLSHMTAHAFEDLLVVSIPCFDRLFGIKEVEDHVSLLLFRAGEWHVLAKFRMHTTSTLTLLHNATIRLGSTMRHFRDVICPRFETVETPSEIRKRQQAEERRKQAGQQSNDPPSSSARAKKFNLNTYKFWALGEYAHYIGDMGVSGNYTTSIGERAHRRQKAHYNRTSKKDATTQIVGKENQLEAHRLLGQAHTAAPECAEAPSHNEEKLVGDPDVHHVISRDTRDPVAYGAWLSELNCDAALENFLPSLLEHCATRLMRDYKGPASLSCEQVAQELRFDRNRLFSHATMRVNYTSYDIRRRQDMINVNSGKNSVMVLTDDTATYQRAHPFRFARVLRIFHGVVEHPVLAPETRCIELLFVRWFEHRDAPQLDWNRTHLDKVSFVPITSDDAFGFLDPGQVLRACHIVPAYADGRTKELLGPSIFRPEDGDYAVHYVAQFSNDDLAMRFLGLGVGHVGLVPRVLVERSPPIRIDPDPDPVQQNAGSDETGARDGNASGSSIPITEIANENPATREDAGTSEDEDEDEDEDEEGGDDTEYELEDEE